MERIKKIKDVECIDANTIRIKVQGFKELILEFEKYWDTKSEKYLLRTTNNPSEILDLPYYLYIATKIKAEQVLIQGNIMVIPFESRTTKKKFYLSSKERATCECGYTDPAIMEVLEREEEIYETTCPNCGQSRRVPGTGAPIFWKKKKSIQGRG